MTTIPTMLPTVMITLWIRPSRMLESPPAVSTSAKLCTLGRLGGVEEPVVSASSSDFSAVMNRK